MSEHHPIQVDAVLERASSAFLARWFDWLKIGVVVWLLFLILGYLLHRAHWAGALVLVLIGGPLAVGVMKSVMQLAREELLSLRAIMNGFENYGTSFLAGIVLGAIMTVGGSLHWIGSIVAIACLFLYLPLICDGSNPFAALQRSVEFLLRQPVGLLILALLLVFFNAVLAILTWTVGLIAAVPFTLLVSVVVYEESRPDETPAPPAEE